MQPHQNLQSTTSQIRGNEIDDYVLNIKKRNLQKQKEEYQKYVNSKKKLIIQSSKADSAYQPVKTLYTTS